MSAVAYPPIMRRVMCGDNYVQRSKVDERKRLGQKRVEVGSTMIIGLSGVG